ncbi:MAG: response regulator transcription factor [Bacteroidetes bacterium]|jgi:two-component system, OmpR family, alkaline phosphatase synthesis response regulator PhoP|nr:response regulator transcription factor [Bacteroidota bacterium]MBT6685541.1 response regulator transcription factor [Bacteroidota bacterium]MBT7143657.1 response regulator transcription factor [Bacteroidota bacterium]MBT7491596.1 response regulator transcription factor [Bacteroidota bacterium]
MEHTKYKILLVDDEEDILEFLSYNLRKAGYIVATANNGRDAIILANQDVPHLILMDIMMPKMDGIETCEEIRFNPKMQDTIIAFLTARGEDYSQIAGFEAGADDYITKPIKPKVLLSRIKALLKRYGKQTDSSKEGENIIDISNLIINKEKHLVTVDGKEVSFPRKEYELLLLMSTHPGIVITRNEIFLKIWGDDVIVGDRTIDVHIRKLREKIGNNHIKTIKGVGYKFVE